MKTILFAAAAAALAFVSTNAKPNLASAAATNANSATLSNATRAPDLKAVFVQQPINTGMHRQRVVPEATTWVMMLAGFGMIGLGVRARGDTARRGGAYADIPTCCAPEGCTHKGGTPYPA